MKQYSMLLPDCNKGEFVRVITDTPITVDCEADYDVYCPKCNELVPYTCCYEFENEFYCENCILDVVKESNHLLELIEDYKDYKI